MHKYLYLWLINKLIFDISNFCLGQIQFYFSKNIHYIIIGFYFRILTKKDTGHITPEVADKLMLTFKDSSNDDMFFIDVEYNEKEKHQLMG